MENASHALLIAGGILIALLIVGSLVMLFTNLQDYQNQNDVSVKQAQIADFNNQFEPFNKTGLTLMELKSVYNKITSNNIKHPEYTITTNITAIYPDITTDFTQIDEQEKTTRRFECTDIQYGGPEGRISSITFAVTI